jgi:hypothetical protein
MKPSPKCECPTWVKILAGISTGVAILIGIILLFYFMERK